MLLQNLFRIGCFLLLGFFIPMTGKADSVLTHPFPLHCNFGCPINQIPGEPTNTRPADIYPSKLFTMGIEKDGQPGLWLAYLVTPDLLTARDERRIKNQNPSLSILTDDITTTPDTFFGNKSLAWNELLIMEERLAVEPGIYRAHVITGELRHHSTQPSPQEKHGYWKIISINTTAHAFVSAFIFPKGSEKAENYCSYLVDVAEIERETGLLFFPLSNLIDPVQSPDYFKNLAPHIECP